MELLDVKLPRRDRTAGGERMGQQNARHAAEPGDEFGRSTRVQFPGTLPGHKVVGASIAR